ncbi:CotH kinase family protein [Bacillus atrophaeus]|uniref:CotH kinase family protein n=1 Tax=Bacillus atrophaeus TaxID=1452 RepID=UPI001C106914|nr:CotH kinase family protein [Bacillus atrophaeus]MBU5264295.1 CotH kinase family protein [Bacillus atrophaeus]
METISLYFHPQQIQSNGSAAGLLVSESAASRILIRNRGGLNKKSYVIEYENGLHGKRTIYLNAEEHDPSLIRRRLAYHFFSQIGVLSPLASHVFLHINGREEGIYVKIEAVDDHFLKERHMPCGAIYEARYTDPRIPLFGTENGLFNALSNMNTPKHDAYLQEFLSFIHSAADDEFAARIKTYLDVKLFYLWLIGSACTRHSSHFALYLNRGAGRFQIVPQETRELVLNTLADDDMLLANGQTLAARLLAITAFKAQYHALLKNVLTREFTIDRLSQKIREWHLDICPRISGDPYISGTCSSLEREQTKILHDIEHRQALLHLQLATL